MGKGTLVIQTPEREIAVRSITAKNRKISRASMSSPGIKEYEVSTIPGFYGSTHNL